MASVPSLEATALNKFELNFDRTREDLAHRARGDFMRAFPVSRLASLDVDEYVIGHRQPTFCDYVEPKTAAWAVIMGATAIKFGIYYGKTKSDPTVRYRFASKFGDSKDSAFRAVKRALLDLVHLGANDTLDFEQIDANPLSQLFKAKILSLYFPEKFLNVCSRDHLEQLAGELGLPGDRFASEYQHLLVEARNSHPATKTWSNPKFMMYLYQTYIDKDEKPDSEIAPPKKKKHRRVNMDDMQRGWARIGKLAETFALEWEKERLRGAGLEHLISDIDDRRDRPGYGYDLLSHTSRRKPRYIEVKAVRLISGLNGYRFFLSDNEYAISLSQEHHNDYYFYLVFFDGTGKPQELWPVQAEQLFKRADLKPASFMVGFTFTR